MFSENPFLSVKNSADFTIPLHEWHTKYGSTKNTRSNDKSNKFKASYSSTVCFLLFFLKFWHYEVLALLICMSLQTYQKIDKYFLIIHQKMKSVSARLMNDMWLNIYFHFFLFFKKNSSSFTTVTVPLCLHNVFTSVSHKSMCNAASVFIFLLHRRTFAPISNTSRYFSWIPVKLPTHNYHVGISTDLMGVGEKNEPNEFQPSRLK